MRCRQEHQVGTLKSWVQVLKAWWLSTFTIWGLGPKETSKCWLGNYLKSIHHLEMPTQNVLSQKNYFKNITASPDFYPNDPKSSSMKMSNTAQRAVSKSVQSNFNATRYRKSTQMSKHLAHLLNGSFQYRLPNLQDDEQALRAAVSMEEDQLVRHRILGLLRDPVCAQG